MSVKSDHAERWEYMDELLTKGKPKNDPTKEKRKYILRCDNDELYQHYYRVEIRVKGKRHKKYFADKACGGKSFALLSALVWRDAKIKELGIIHLKDVVQQPYNHDAKGVYHTKKTVRGKAYDVVVAQWRDSTSGKSKCRQKQFSVNKYGLKKALRLAKKHRDDQLKELYG